MTDTKLDLDGMPKVGMALRAAYHFLQSPESYSTSEKQFVYHQIAQAEQERTALLAEHKATKEALVVLESQSSVTVGNGLSVSGSGEAVRRVQAYIILDAPMAVEKADNARHFAIALQAAEAELSATKERLAEMEADRDAWKADAKHYMSSQGAAEAQLVRAKEGLERAVAAIEATIECSAIDWIEDITPSKRGEEDDDEIRLESKSMVLGLLTDAAAVARSTLKALEQG